MKNETNGKNSKLAKKGAKMGEFGKIPNIKQYFFW
jgi:hypothetical protein